MKNKKIIITIASAMLMTTALNSAVFNNYANAQDIKINSDNADGKLMLKADVGYVYSFGGDWNKSNAQSPSIGGNKSTATGGVGYGASLGYSHKSGIGLSADYLGFNHKWAGLGTDVNLKTEFNYDASYHVVTLVPSYRIKLDAANNWGLRVGLGVGFSLSDVAWAQKISANNGAQSGGVKVAGGAVYSGAPQCPMRKDVASDSAGQPGLASTCELSAAEVSDDSIANWLINVGVTSDGRQFFHIPDSTIISTEGNNGPVAAGILSQVKKATDDARAACTARGAAYTYTIANGVCNALTPTPTPTPTPTNNIPTASSGGSAKDDAGFVLAPQVALEYDNGMLHADLNVKYIHELFNVRYFGSEGSVSGQKESGAITYTSIAGPLALFVGAGFGMNF